jgi:hypothetical protein
VYDALESQGLGNGRDALAEVDPAEKSAKNCDAKA